MSAPWELREPSHIKRNGRGDMVLENMPTGEYTLTWGYVANHVTPAAELLVLEDEQTISFEAYYIYTDYGEEYKLIPGSLFWMGSAEDEMGRNSDEIRHRVTLTYDFWIRPTEVTCREYRDMVQWAYDHDPPLVTVVGSRVVDLIDMSMSDLVDMDDIGSVLSFDAGVFNCITPDKPMVEVTWFGAAAYCDWMNMKENFPVSYNHSYWQPLDVSVYGSRGYRLPTEAEWEYACGMGSELPFNTGACLDASSQANIDGTFAYADCPTGPYMGEARNVASYSPSYWNLYDMHGNIAEWCWDDYQPYSPYPTINPVNVGSGVDRVVRGGSFNDPAVDCRTSARARFDRGSAYSYLGFRYVRTN